MIDMCLPCFTNYLIYCFFSYTEFMSYIGLLVAIYENFSDCLDILIFKSREVRL